MHKNILGHCFHLWHRFVCVAGLNITQAAVCSLATLCALWSLTPGMIPALLVSLLMTHCSRWIHNVPYYLL